MPGPSDQEMRGYLDADDFGGLFRRLGWDNPIQGLSVTVEAEESGWEAEAVADKRGVTVWSVECGEIPPRSVQHQIVKAAKRQSRDQLVVFASPGEQLWLWPEQRPSGVGHRLVDHHYRPHHGNDALLQRLSDVCFTMAEQPELTAVKVLDRVRRSFNVEKVTKSFFREFKGHHEQLAEHIEGIPRPDDQRWYASVLMNRLMFVYFIQRKGFVAGDRHYLRSRLGMVRERLGDDRFYAFFRRFLLPFFHEGLGSPPAARRYDDPAIEQIIGDVPYVNGGIFEPHALESTYDIQIPDTAFEKLFDFFDQWRWHLDERPTGDSKEINPDILGFIFEQYVNKKQQGAYYTKPDVTGYMATSAIIPAVVDRLVDAGLDDPCVLLPNSGDDYLHDAMSYGVDVPLPDGDLPPSEFPDAALDIALPGERWCDVTHRRKRHAEVKETVNSGGVGDINDAVTQNLDLGALMVDYLFALNDADECQRVFEVLRSLTVCDPTVGSGAFLLAALDVLDPLYAAVLNRAEEIAAGGAWKPYSSKRLGPTPSSVTGCIKLSA
ncbi:MAG: hypothetical protein KTV68_15540 [Acidimicrobiia bacterium]|nr:hypothetical protein [Acidimicrobiia bacterium]